jgi:DNA-binding response OmpR family regulator
MRQTPYSCALVDIRLPDLNGYEIYHRLREIQPQTPIILMTGFGYDPTHSIVKARQEGLQTVLYKPFRTERLMEAVEQALRIAPASPSTSPAPHRQSAPTDNAAARSPGALIATPTEPSTAEPPAPASAEPGAAEAEPGEQASQEGQGEPAPTEIPNHEP